MMTALRRDCSYTLYSLLLTFALTLNGVLPLTVDECLTYVNDVGNDPHDWMMDGSAVKSGEDISVTCNSGYVPILGLTVREFCDTADGSSVSVCMPTDMVLVHQRLTEGDKNWGCTTVDNGDGRVAFVPYINCSAIAITTSFKFIYDEGTQKQALAVDYSGSRFYLRIRSGVSRSTLFLTKDLAFATLPLAWYYVHPTDDTFTISSGSGRDINEFIWYLHSSGEFVRAGPALSVSSDLLLNVYFNGVVNSSCASNDSCQRFASDLFCNADSLCSCAEGYQFIENSCMSTTPTTTTPTTTTPTTTSPTTTTPTTTTPTTTTPTTTTPTTTTPTTTTPTTTTPTTTTPSTTTPTKTTPTTTTPTTTTPTTTTPTTTTPTTTVVTLEATTKTKPSADSQAFLRCRSNPGRSQFRLGCSCWKCFLSVFPVEQPCSYQPPSCL